VVEFLAAGAAQRERRYELIKEEFLAECRLRSLEPPSADQTDRWWRSERSDPQGRSPGRSATAHTAEPLRATPSQTVRTVSGKSPIG
jgi:hypothetical protein